MNQRSLYATLDKAGCKILSFEDYPSTQGSWRVCFVNAGRLCEISSYRFDGILTLKAKTTQNDLKKSFISSATPLTDETELAFVYGWLMSISVTDICQYGNTEEIWL